MMKLCLAVALLGLGCDNKKPEERKDDTPVERIEARPAPSPTPNAPAKPADPTTPAPATAELPAECAQLRDAIAKMNQCPKFDNAAKAQLSKQADALFTSASTAGADVAAQCKGTADSIQKAGAAACGW